MKNPKISVALVTYNRKAELLRAIDSIYQQPYRPIEVVVANNGSQDDSVEAIKNTYPEIKIVCLHRNMGCPEGRNVAMANCTGDIIFSLDDDAVLEKETLSRVVDIFNNQNDVAVVACKVKTPGQEDLASNQAYFCYSFSGGAFAIRREVLSESGFFPSDFNRQAEEGFLSLKIIDAGYKIFFEPSASIIHLPSRINRNAAKEIYFGARNEILTISRLFPHRFLFFALIVKIKSWIVKGIKNRAIRDAVFGLIAGLSHLPSSLNEGKRVRHETVLTIKKIRDSRNKLRAKRVS